MNGCFQLTIGLRPNLFVKNNRFDELSLQQLITDFKNVTAATSSFISSLSELQPNLKGFGWKYELTVQEFLKATIGCEINHININKDRYLNN